jgi:hypothetical protein
VKSCRDFYAAETPGLAEQELNEQLMSMDGLSERTD